LAPEQTQPLDGSTLLGYVEEVADALPADGTRRRLIVVGGAPLAWVGISDATRDIDSVEPLDEVIAAVVQLIAERHGLAQRWINDSAAQFAPMGLALDNTWVVLDHPRLEVLGASLSDVFLMKVFAGRAADTQDIAALWPHTTFESIDDVTMAFQAAYSHEEPDPHLGAWLSEVVETDRLGLKAEPPKNSRNSVRSADDICADLEAETAVVTGVVGNLTEIQWRVPLTGWTPRTM
jgi:hypothetical protein